MYLIAKLFLNSLYGRFGLNPSLSSHIISSKKEIDDILSKNLPFLEDRIDIGEFSLCSFYNNRSNVSSNVAIASFVTAYARVLMTKYFNNKEYNLFYTDTDSIIIDKPLSSDLVHDSKMGL